MPIIVLSKNSTLITRCFKFPSSLSAAIEIKLINALRTISTSEIVSMPTK